MLLLRAVKLTGEQFVVPRAAIPIDVTVIVAGGVIAGIGRLGSTGQAEIESPAEKAAAAKSLRKAVQRLGV